MTLEIPSTYRVSKYTCKAIRITPVHRMKMNSPVALSVNQIKRKEVPMIRPTLAIMFQKKIRLLMVCQIP
jgi:nitrous oxidase accessory protein NosD